MDDPFDLGLNTAYTSPPSMSTLFDIEPSGLSWDYAFTTESAMLSPYDTDSFKEEQLEGLNISGIPLSGFSSATALDSSEFPSYATSRAPFDGLIDFESEGVSPSASSPATRTQDAPRVPDARRAKPSSAPGPSTSRPSRLRMSPTSNKESPAGSSNRKRKSYDSAVSPSTRSSPSPPGSPVHKKTSHNMIEKRYRTNLNDKILALRNAVPSLRVAAGGADAQAEDVPDDALSSAQKLSKATILSKATEYIRHLERKTESLEWENNELRNRASKLETMVLNSVSGFGDTDPQRFPP